MRTTNYEVHKKIPCNSSFELFVNQLFVIRRFVFHDSIIPLSQLTEHIVQSSAMAFLEKRYCNKAWGKRLFSQLEVRTRKKYGRKRADGLLAFKHFIFGTYVISMEAKSYRTLEAIKPWKDHGRILLGSLKAGVILNILTGVGLLIFKLNDGYYQYLLPLFVFLFGASLYALLTWTSSRHLVADVLFQIKQYPANEQWLAVSKDSLSRLPEGKRSRLIQLCRNEGIGLLEVKQNKQVKAILTPRRNWLPSFLKYYSIEDKIRKSI